jgi:acetylornithine deacetylase/succinyl-diaminopimelate desuccinylase-like protein
MATSTSSRHWATGRTGLGPYSPVRRGDRLYARGVADDGYACFSALSAIEAMEANDIPHGRCVVLIEASEESGSVDLEAYLDDLAEHLGNVELLICLDSGALTYDRLWVTSSLRGVVNLDLNVAVLEEGRHSGSASGIVPSSFRILRQLLDRVEDATTGEILVEELHATVPESHAKSAHDIAARVRRRLRARLPHARGTGAHGRRRRRENLATKLVPHPLGHRHGRHSRTRHRRQRSSTLHDGRPLVSPPPVG